MTWTAAQRRASRREYDRLYKGSAVRHMTRDVVTMPADIERVDVSEPCFKCGARDDCRHRPWITQRREVAA